MVLIHEFALHTGEQILSCKSAIIHQWTETEIVSPVLATTLPFHSMFSTLPFNTCKLVYTGVYNTKLFIALRERHVGYDHITLSLNCTQFKILYTIQDTELFPIYINFN